MRWIRLGALGGACAVVAVIAAAGVATAASNPTATASQAPVAGSPSAIACGGSVDAQVSITGHAGITGTVTDVLVVVDLSGSTGTPPSKLDNLKAAASATVDALAATGGGNLVGLEYYQGSSATISAAVGSTQSALTSAIGLLPGPDGGSPQNVGISTADTALSSLNDGNAKAIVLITDGQATGSLLSATAAAVATAKTHGIRIVPIGLGTGSDVSETNLENWASDGSSYQAGSPGPISTTKLIADLGAAVATPASFTLGEALGANFTAAPLSSSLGTVTGSGTGTLQWTGSLLDNQTATLTYRATRNGNDVFSPTSELVSTMSLLVAGGTGTVTAPASISIGVLPCGGTPVTSTTCTGAACTASGTSGGQTFTVSAGTPAAGTSVVVTGLSTTPPAGVCPGFEASTNGIEFDITPFTQDATFQYTIPKAQLGRTKWWQTDVCLGTNLKFTTALQSLSNLRPGAKLAGGGAVPGRWWGLLPSIPRYTLIPGLGFVKGPYVSSRSQDSAGNAIVKFVVPFVPGSALFTTDGKPGYDPKRWG